MPTDYAASVQGVSIRVTRLDVNGNLMTGPMDSYTSSSFIRTSFTPEYEDGDEITEKAADGTVCVSFKAPDTLKRVTMEIAICDPDPELSALLSGGLLLSDTDNQGNEVSLGWASAQTGEDPSGNGVAVEVWSRAIQNGKPAPSNPYFQWIFPYVKTRLSGDRVIENGLLATTFEGFGLGNINFRSGPDGTWRWPAAVDRPYLYARTPWAPQGIRGFFQWTPGTPAVPGSGTPGQGGYVPPVAQGVPSASDPITTLDDKVKAGYNVPNGGTLYPRDLNLDDDNILSSFDYLPDESGTISYPAPATSAAVKNPSPTGQPPVTYKKRAGAVTPITGATAGAPGSFQPTGSTLPANIAALRADPVIGNAGTNKPTTGWTTGQYVVLGDSTLAYWSGTQWNPGAALVAITGVVAGIPGTYVPANAAAPASLTALKAHAAIGDTGTNKPVAAWTTGQFVNLADATKANWSGSAWAAGTHA